MTLLSYETLDGQEGSHNDLIKQLVKKTRYYYSEVSGDEFKMAVPELKGMEAKIQKLDREFGNEHRDYLSDIIDELGQEAEIENVLIEEYKRTASILVPRLAENDFNFEDFALDFRIVAAIPYLEFDGYENGKTKDYTLSVVKDILKSLCAKHSVIFIDGSDT
jgi:hypothetical protein